MTKTDMMANFDAIMTDERLTRRAVEDHLAASSRVPSPLLDDYGCLASGGSSGQRGVFVQTIGEYSEFIASILRRGMARMIAAGGPPPDGAVIGMVAAASPIHSTGFGAAIASGAVRFVSVPATLPVAEVVDRLNAVAPPALMGYPTKLAQLAREQLAGRLRIAPVPSPPSASRSPRRTEPPSRPPSACPSSTSSARPKVSPAPASPANR
ncbi:MAG: hypothetical protein ACRD0A_15465 [Acidimicrobiales bacterium]